MAIQDKQMKLDIAHVWDISSATYDNKEGHGIQSEIEKEAWKTLFRSLLPSGRLEVLDAGCGTGEIGLLFTEMGHHVTGLDLSEQMLAKAREKTSRKKYDINFRAGDAENPPFEAETFDVVVTRHLLWTLPHPDTAVRNWEKVLRKGGVLIVIDGLYNGGSIERKTRQFISDFLTFLVERRYPGRKQYPDEIKTELPNPYGVPPKKTIEYFRKTGFKNIKDLDLKEISKIQKEKMSFRKRIVFKPQSHLIYGEKV
ncbi:TPA: class I SAM-dependent methyltransferase [Methanosarcina acetivorans]|uniref:Phosphatidylethanolamine N-methyltransferase n=2 Tax=Methanosarcina acetivorans TaxID=2214 RepID=Q8TSM6_METAC|nr:class I SAM-dependent methyltransferase [Methanosarcina acetivorans]AAM04209.1 phosphatidylethanolamine N-methyltransferase [Methanosarcina acetivorans C2A]HIH95552.1 class I SAM-dependent methyltransferase [Methanosarcina acetivorans]